MHASDTANCAPSIYCRIAACNNFFREHLFKIGKYSYPNITCRGGIQIVKKKEIEQRDSHLREAYTAEGHERYTPTPTHVSITPIPSQPIAPIPIPTPRSIEHPSNSRKELTTIKGINKKRALQLEKLGIDNIDDLAKASAEKLAKNLKVDLHIVQKWISTAKKLQ